MSRAPRHAGSSRRGFSLLELSASLLVIALVAGFGVQMSLGAIEAARRVKTQERLAAIRAALELYAKTQGYLPCPANRQYTPSADSNFGEEFGRPGATCVTSAPGVIQVGSGFIGAVPVRSLGLPDNYAADAWDNKFTYAVSSLHVTGPGSYAGNDGTIRVFYGDRTGTNYVVTSATNRAASPPTISPGAGATYVVVSHGPDGRGAYPLYGTAVATACSTGGGDARNDVENCDDANLDFYDTAYNDGPIAATYFDDYVTWGSAALARSPVSTTFLGCGSQCEAWCAPCAGSTTDLPVITPTAAPAGLTNPVLCRKIITNTSPCQATCVWAGLHSSGYFRCP